MLNYPTTKPQESLKQSLQIKSEHHGTLQDINTILHMHHFLKSKTVKCDIQLVCLQGKMAKT